MTEFLDRVDGYVWSNALVYLCLATGVYFSVRSRFVQVRRLPQMVRLIVHGAKSSAGVSSFQALSMSLAGRVGTGNIAGVATAIAFGGPGALFWMWAVAFLGASTSFVECTLGQIYKVRDRLTGEYRGGPAYYLSLSMAHTRAAPAFKLYGLIFAAVAALACGLFLPGLQANSMASAMAGAWGLPNAWVAAGIAIVLGVVVIGGVKRIAAFASVVVPVMAVTYIAVAVVIVVVNPGEVPEILRMIFASAFGIDSVFGAIVGSAVMWGVKRGIFSNEAGQGSGPHAAAAAEVSHPAKQGLVQAFAVYVDTLFICTATGFLILSTGAYRVHADESVSGAVLAQGGTLPPGVQPGPAFAQAGFDMHWNGAGSSFVAVSLAFFCLTTIIAYYYIAETNLLFLLGKWASARIRLIGATAGRLSTFVLQVLLLASVVWGAVSTATTAWTLGDIGVGLMAWLNIVAILILQKPAFTALRDFDRQLKAGIDPTFDPHALAIRGTAVWQPGRTLAGQLSRSKA